MSYAYKLFLQLQAVLKGQSSWPRVLTKMIATLGAMLLRDDELRLENVINLNWAYNEGCESCKQNEYLLYEWVMSGYLYERVG